MVITVKPEKLQLNLNNKKPMPVMEKQKVRIPNM